jgi:hypothetical protein
MPTADRLRGAMHAQPFQPFDIKLVDGTIYTIKHPEYLSVPPSPRPREITFYTDVEKGDDYKTHWINLGLVLEVIVPSESQATPAQPKAEGNGA